MTEDEIENENLHRLIQELGSIGRVSDESGVYETRNSVTEEKREVIRNQIDVIRHQRNLAFSILRLNIALLSLVLGFLVAVLVLQRQELGNALEGISSGEPTTGGLFFVSVVLLVGVFLYYSIVYSHRFMTDSLGVVQSGEDDWGLDTTEGITDTGDIGTQDILDNQDRAISNNSDSIEKNDKRISGFVEDSTSILISLGSCLSLIVFLGFVSQLIFVPRLLIGGLAIVIGASGVPSIKFILDHYV